MWLYFAQTFNSRERLTADLPWGREVWNKQVWWIDNSTGSLDWTRVALELHGGRTRVTYCYILAMATMGPEWIQNWNAECVHCKHWLHGVEDIKEGRCHRQWRHYLYSPCRSRHPDQEYLLSFGSSSSSSFIIIIIIIIIVIIIVVIIIIVVVIIIIIIIIISSSGGSSSSSTATTTKYYHYHQFLRLQHFHRAFVVNAPIDATAVCRSSQSRSSTRTPLPASFRSIHQHPVGLPLLCYALLRVGVLIGKTCKTCNPAVEWLGKLRTARINTM